MEVVLTSPLPPHNPLWRIKTVWQRKTEIAGLYHDGHPVVGVYPAVQAQALWNYIFIAVEDGSLGTHNSPYTNALLDASIAVLQ